MNPPRLTPPKGRHFPNYAYLCAAEKKVALPDTVHRGALRDSLFIDLDNKNVVLNPRQQLDEY